MVHRKLDKSEKRCIPNLRIVCNSWGFKGNVEPVKIIEAADGEMCATLATIRLYTRKSLLKKSFSRNM